MDGHGRPPMSIFTVDDYVPFPPQIRRKPGKGRLLLQISLLVFALLALCGAASEIYFLMKVESRLSATQDLIEENAGAQKMLSRQGFRDGTPSAHVTGLSVKDTSPSSPLQWEHKLGLAFLHKVEYNNGSLVCPKTGLYFIYSKLQLRLASCSKDLENPFFSHRVIRRSSSVDIPLIEDLRRFCDTQGSSIWRGNSFIGGSFMLAKDDKVYVSMSQKHLIRAQEDTMTFFGMFMIWTTP
ncbi:hypothetical protein GDO81_008896 [Engystomops pustulosus]|uniref:THD domain-containing protein n=1 Tax=Engystomops pustulosus TaxID=76066 RepID=A0AAV7BNF3_ENGPU|nr:hypothetical protein GDO81_008896 [Engystomops pustulosus]KAG8573873.1 hypothetical protein GDO81_008896 [Engystomops pustulosus]